MRQVPLAVQLITYISDSCSREPFATEVAEKLCFEHVAREHNPEPKANTSGDGQFSPRVEFNNNLGLGQTPQPQPLSGSNSQVCPNNFYGSPYLFCPGNQTYSSCVREDYKSWWCSTTANELAECDDQKCPLEAWGKLLIITSQMEVALA